MHFRTDSRPFYTRFQPFLPCFLKQSKASLRQYRNHVSASTTGFSQYSTAIGYYIGTCKSPIYVKLVTYMGNQILPRTFNLGRLCNMQVLIRKNTSKLGIFNSIHVFLQEK